MLAMLFARRLFTGALGALALIVFNLFIRSVIPATSRLNVIKYANLISLLRTNELLGGYRNLYWFDHPIPLLLVECVAAVLFGILFALAFCFISAVTILLQRDVGQAEDFSGVKSPHSRRQCVRKPTSCW